jgi:homoserine acetyltransferase
MPRRMTDEERVAIKLGNILSDLRVDLDLVGQYLARISPTVVYNRLLAVTESATYEKEDKHNGYKY